MTIAEWRDSKMTRPFETVLAEWTSLKERLAKLTKELDESFLIMKSQAPIASQTAAHDGSRRNIDLERLQGLTIRDAAREYLRQMAVAGNIEVLYGRVFDDLQRVPNIRQNSAGGKPWREGQGNGWRSMCITFVSNPGIFKTNLSGKHANRNDSVELVQPRLLSR
jgi:hypothetical protein